jgi:predicted nucleic-acid-binding protein
MKLLDTSVLLEFFSGNEETIDRIDKIFRELERQKEKLLIPEEVLVELAYYLEKVHGWEREVVAEILTTVMSDSLFKVESREILSGALKLYKKSKLDFLDCLKVSRAKKRKVNEVITLRKVLERGGLKVIRP